MARLQLAARGENVLFLPQNLDIWGQKSIFCLVIAIFVDGTNDHYTRGYNFPIGTTPKKFSVSELGVIFWGSPLFLAIPTLEGQLPLILVRFQRNSGESSGPSKNDPEGQRTRSRPELRRNGRFYARPKSGFWPKNGFYPKKSPKMTFPPLIIWAKALFFFKQLFPVVARTWLGEKSVCLFLGPKFRFLAQKSDFCHTAPILVDDPFLALGMTVNFPPWERFFDFPFRSYSCFCKKIQLTAQKVFPLPPVGVPSASNSPSALSARAGQRSSDGYQ